MQSRSLLVVVSLLAIPVACTSEQPARADQQARPDPDSANVSGSVSASSAGALPTGRYACYRLSAFGDEIAGDLVITNGAQYEYVDEPGRYRYDDTSQVIEWESGPLHQPSSDWVGVFAPEGASIAETGGTIQDHQIEIRRRSDVQAGNMAAMQRCDFAG